MNKGRKRCPECGYPLNVDSYRSTFILPGIGGITYACNQCRVKKDKVTYYVVIWKRKKTKKVII